MNDKEKTELFKNQDWSFIIKDITFYAYSRFKFWNLLNEKGVKGYSPQDIAYQAIELVLNGDWNWNPKKSDLLPYLKYHVVKGLVANLAANKEVRKSDNTLIEELDIITYSEEENLNAEQILELISKELKDEKVLYDIFVLLYEGLKRKEICKTLKIELKDYNNHIRRLKSRLLKMDKSHLFDSIKHKQ